MNVQVLITIPEEAFEALAQHAAELVVRETASQAAQAELGWLNVEGAAAYLSTTKGAIRSLVSRRKIPFSKTPHNRILFSRNDLDRYVRSGYTL